MSAAASTGSFCLLSGSLSPAPNRFLGAEPKKKEKGTAFFFLVTLGFGFCKRVDYGHASVAEALFVAANHRQAVDSRRRGQKCVKDRNRLFQTQSPELVCHLIVQEDK